MFLALSASAWRLASFTGRSVGAWCLFYRRAGRRWPGPAGAVRLVSARAPPGAADALALGAAVLVGIGALPVLAGLLSGRPPLRHGSPGPPPATSSSWWCSRISSCCWRLIESIRPVRARALRVLGDCSYSIYLLHFPLQLFTVICLDAAGVGRAVFGQPLTFVVVCAAVRRQRLIPLWLREAHAAADPRPRRRDRCPPVAHRVLTAAVSQSLPREQACRGKDLLQAILAKPKSPRRPNAAETRFVQVTCRKAYGG